MNSHIFKYYLLIFNDMEELKNLYMIKPEFGGIGGCNWRYKINKLIDQQTIVSNKLKYYYK